MRHQLCSKLIDVLMNDPNVVSFVGITVRKTEEQPNGIYISKLATNPLEVLQILEYALEMDDAE